MSENNTMRATTAINAIAERENSSPEEIRTAIQEALDDAWESAWAPGNLHAQVAWQRLFPGVQKPTVEEFVAKLSMQILLLDSFPEQINIPS